MAEATKMVKGPSGKVDQIYCSAEYFRESNKPEIKREYGLELVLSLNNYSKEKKKEGRQILKN